MRKELGILLGGAGALLLALLGSSRKGRPRTAPRIMLIGDSLAVGLERPLGALAAAAGVPFEGHGVTGTRIGQWSLGDKAPMNHLDGWLAAFRPTHVLVSLGTNDAAGSGVDRASVETLLRKILAAGAVPLWIGPPAMPPRIALNAVQEAVRSTGVVYLSSDRLEIPRAADGIHPTSLGYGHWARAVWDWAMSEIVHG